MYVQAGNVRFFFSDRAFCLSEAQAELVKRAHAPAGHLRLQSENLGRRRRRAGSASRAQWCTLGKMHCAPSSVSRAPWERCTVCLVLYLAHLGKDAVCTLLGGKHVLCTLALVENRQREGSESDIEGVRGCNTVRGSETPKASQST